MEKKLFRKFSKKIVRQSFLKALLFSATVGFFAVFLTAFFLWFFSISLKALLISLSCVFCGVTLILLPISYFRHFKPTEEKIAWIIDRLGLEERMVTMCERKEDASSVAALQRKDAKERLSRVSKRDVSLRFSRLALILLCVAFLSGASMTTLSALAATGNVRQAGELFTPPQEEEEEEEQKEYVTVDYLAGEGGIIQGETHQVIEKGEDADPVTATPLDGYAFVVWSDGIMTAQRWDWSIMEDMQVEAQFEPLPKNEGSSGSEGEEGEEGEGEGEGEDGDKQDGEDGEEGKEGDDKDGDGDGDSNGEDGEGDGDAPGEGQGPNGEGEGGNQGGAGEGNGGGNDGDNPGAGPNKGDGNGSSAGPGASPGGNTDNNFVVDGKTDYHDVVDSDKSKEEVSEDDSLPPELKDILDGYFDSLKP